MTNAKIYHAVIGCGRVATNHVDAFSRIEAVQLHYACDLIEHNAHKLAKTADFTHFTTDYEQVLADPQVKSISLATPHDLHAQMTLQAIHQNKHVLVEKPFVIDPDEGEQIIQAAQAKGVVVMPVTQHRFDPMIQLVAELVQGGELGQLTLVRAHLECTRDPAYYRDSPWRGSWQREGGSVLLNQAYHIADLLLWLAGPTAKIHSQIANLANQDVMETEDTVCSTIQFTSGALGSLTVTGAAGSQWKSFIELLGTEGVIAFDINYPNTILRLNLNQRRSLQAWKKRIRICQKSQPLPAPGIGYYGISHRKQAQAFVEAIAGTLPQYGATLTHALNVVKFIQTVYQTSTPISPMQLPTLG